MPEGVEKATEELRGMGYSPERCHEHTNRAVVFIDYTVPRGEYCGKKIRIGIQIPPRYNDAYPHYVHLPADITLPRGGVGGSEIPGYRKWSRPPKDLWEEHGTMEWYVDRHLRRLWEAECYDE